jgi:hypothetical protein
MPSCSSGLDFFFSSFLLFCLVKNIDVIFYVFYLHVIQKTIPYKKKQWRPPSKKKKGGKNQGCAEVTSVQATSGIQPKLK